MPRRSPPALAALAATLALTSVSAAATDEPSTFDPAYENANYSKLQERPQRDADPAFQADLRSKGLASEAEAASIIAGDSERNFTGNLCWQHMDGCAGDVRLYDWGASGYGLSRAVLWTARNGSTISGHVWMTVAGPPKRPGIVITNGSVQAPEELYLFAATTLAKKGYVVLTWDPQGQGRSDTYGEGVDQQDGVPSQTGAPFVDGTEDALDFFFSKPAAPYHPRPSCSSATDHSPKQDRRVRSGLDAAYNPFWSSLDAGRVGIAGHSLGAAAVSYVGQADPRVRAIVAWDNLAADRTTGTASLTSQMGTITCAKAPGTRLPVPITKPALGMSADYGLVRQPNTALPDPQGKNNASIAYSARHVDNGELTIRGGSHYEFSYIPNPYFGATLRGIDMVAWYTGAWFDRYVKGDPGADARLLAERWRADRQAAAVDPAGDPNMFSGYYRSRLDIGLAGGGRFVCEDMRHGCPGLAADGLPADYSYLSEARTRDAGAPRTSPSGPLAPPARARRLIRFPGARRCVSRRRIVLHLRRVRGLAVRSVTVVVGGRIRGRHGGGRGSIRISLRGLPPGHFTVDVVVVPRHGHRFVLRRRYRTCARHPRRPR